MCSSVTTKDELMAEVENETRQLKKKEFFPYKIIGTLIFSLLLSIVIEWGGIAFQYWDPPGYLHSKLVMQNEFGWFSSEFQKNTALQCAGTIY